MNELVAFDFESHPVRIVTGTDGQPHFVAADICDALQIVEVHRSVARLDDDEKGRHIVTTPGGPQEMTVVNEAGLYNLILRSRKPEAKRFKRWVTHEVLPSIRKTGAYAAPGSIAALPAPTQDRVTSILLIGEAVARVPGVKPGIAIAAALTCIHENTGLAVETMRRALPASKTRHWRQSIRPNSASTSDSRPSRSIVVSPIWAISTATNATNGNSPRPAVPGAKHCRFPATVIRVTRFSGSSMSPTG